MGLLSAIGDRTVYLDSNVFIYYLNAFPPYTAELKQLFAAIEAADIQSITSLITLTELLVKPFRDGDLKAAEACQRTIRSRRGLKVIQINRAISVEAARLRATSKARVPDAIHLATARLAGCGVVISNNHDLPVLSDLPTLYLSDFATP